MTQGPGRPLLAEDVMLVLFQPASGTIAGENTLFYVLGGAVLTELGAGGHVAVGGPGPGGARVEAVEGGAPADPLLRSGWDHVATGPRSAGTVLAAIGPRLRGPVLDRLVERGDIRRVKRRTLGLFDSTALEDGGGRRAGLVEGVRAVLEDGAPPEPRVAALAALVSASGSLPQLHREIPWNSEVIARAKALERGDWGAGAAAEAVARTTTAAVAGSVAAALAAANALPPQG
ncbi:GOLPH3/VPS74 family protein [Nocardiopsis changdeensis]|uniref:GPP34 family phosphoprotein n=1 Tax=Nocardiopsis changdeensis TaxID=2831969 RepID=A0ABX8BM39_9ACTN|nr:MULTISPECIES: GPP34 family phosphoprotein [Nocardiopsis]QUX23156.1 GPP34 family phosphoprotein [Nocardiopsis changdeensis]QYX39099.1 GPP34 family phosphoprotein [Nocardiopsis sp. MT53]